MKALNPGDFVRTDVETNKQFTLTETSSLLAYARGEKQVGSFFTESADKSNDFFKGPLFGSIKSQFYLEPYRNNTTQSLHTTASFIQISQTAFDEKIKEGSVSLVSGSDTFIDDSEGNLILSGSSTHIGNVFYENGTIIITNTGSSYIDTVSGSFELKFKASHIKTTLEFSSTIQPNEFNASQNPTATFDSVEQLITGSVTESVFRRPRYTYNVNEVTESYDEGISSQSLIPEFFGVDPSGSSETRLTPYVTTIGYYNDNNELLAIAKVATPTPMPTDFPITFKSRIDI